MKPRIFPHIHIVTCGSLAQEMRQVAEETGTDFLMKVFPSTCHRDPESLGKYIEKYVEENSTHTRFFIAYGRCCNINMVVDENFYWLPSLNCAAILLGGNARYEQFGHNSYFLTPHLALTWRKYFFGKDHTPADAQTQSKLAKWFRPITRIVQIEIHSASSEMESKSAQEFAFIIQKPLVRVKGDLRFLRHEYKFFYRRV